MDRLVNLFAAQALAVTDRLLAAQPGGGVSFSERAALVTLLAHPGKSVSWLGGVLGLTSSGITRLTDRLVEAGWVTRNAAADGRSRTLRLTDAGATRARDVLRARGAATQALLAPLSVADRNELERLLGLLVASMAEERLPALQICRLCDRSACTDAAAECPLQHTVVEAQTDD